MTLRMSIVGAVPPHWQSLARVDRFYRQALASQFRLVPNSEAADLRFYFRLNCSGLGELGHGSPTIVALHGACVLEPGRVRLILSRLRECDGVIVTCSADEAIVRLMCADLHPAILRPTFTSEVRRVPRSGDHLRKLRGIPAATQIVTFVARLVPHKNVHVFVELIASLARRVGNVVGIIVGDYWGDYPLGMTGTRYREHLIDCVRKLGVGPTLIRFTGDLSDAELSILFGGSDLTVSPSLMPDENFGFVPVESICAGTPVVTTDYGGMRDNIEQGRTGYRVQTWVSEAGIRMDQPRLFAAAERVLRGRQLHGKLSRYCRLAARRFTEPENATRFAMSMFQCFNRFAEGQVRRLATRELPTSAAATRCRLGEGGDEWPVSREAARFYASSPDVPDIGMFARLTAYGSHRIVRGVLNVSDPLTSFAVSLSAVERRVIARIAGRGVGPAALSPDERNAAQSLLDVGAIVGTTERSFYA